MSQPPNEDVLTLAKKLREELASSNLPPKFAKLYSQHSRLREGQAGLKGWEADEEVIRLDEATRLIEVAFIEKEAQIENWQISIRRAGELLEWLSHPQLNPEQLPLRLLAAAAYQLAGYPARATGLFNEELSEVTESKILRWLLKADFPALFQQLAQYWTTTLSLPPKEFSWSNPNAFQQLIVNETASSLGILCAAMRWGEEPRLEKALNKLASVSKLLLHSQDAYSWLLAKLCAEVVITYQNSAMRTVLQDFLPNLDERGKTALERYIRINYDEKKGLIWPSQSRGIECLVQEDSFALCTPTGSGKTTVAELAILQSLFNQTHPHDDEKIAPLAIYLVPSRALATEVEIKLNRVFRRIHQPNVQITGLYGGIDWGPTDAWLTTEEPTVLICTYEKAEALIRFLGVLFLYRTALIVIDEAHSVQFNGQSHELQRSESRSLRLESLITRLLTYYSYFEPKRKNRIIALSAVTAGAEKQIAQWLTGYTEAEATQIHYRSTRQLVGRLECLPNREFQIYYDLLDNAGLQFEETDHKGSPFVPKPFPAHPSAPNLEKGGIEKRLRPYLFWAAMHLAALDGKGQQRAVLISVTQGMGGYAKDLLQLIEKTRNNIEQLTLFKEPTDRKKIESPIFFKKPTDKKLELWEKCLQACEDYYGKSSYEYRLLQQGIVVHHGKMPGLMARLLIEVIQERIVHLVLATSTLSEGVNLPFETVLIPTLKRGNNNISVQEFNNLIGRAGRPGFGTEGRGLVLLHPQSPKWDISRDLYFKFIKDLKERKTITNDSNAKSPLAELLILIKTKWQELTGSTDENEFLIWLEETAPLTLEEQNISPAVESLDTLDGILLSNLVEIEQIKLIELTSIELTSNELEDILRRVWQRSYAYYATEQEGQWENIFIQRGKSLNTKIYPDRAERKRLYHTSLPPRAGKQLLDKYQDIVELLKKGEKYATYDDDKKFKYISTIVDSIKTLPKFNFDKEKIGKSSWEQILFWWLNPSKSKWPSEEKVSKWHQYISQNLIYRFNWGLGSIIALAIDDAHKGRFMPSSLDDWLQTGLPWIVFWLKELITWGTLEPVAAYLLAKGIKFTRADAQRIAQKYYKQVQTQPPNEQLDARTIRNWVIEYNKAQKVYDISKKPLKNIQVKLLRDFSKTTKPFFRVIPVEEDNKIYWLDSGGFPLAICDKTDSWNSNYLNIFDFKLNPIKKLVLTEDYI